MKKQNHISFIILLALAACNQAEEESPTIDIAAPVSVVDVTTTSLSRHTVATGNAMAEKEMEVTAQVGGKYQLQNHPAYKRPYKLGDRVEAGQPFVKIEDREYVNGIGLESVKMNLDLAQQEYEKQASVYEKGGVTLRELRNAELQLTQARNDLERAEIQLAKLEIDLPISGVLVKLPQYTPDSRIEQGAPLATIMDYSRMYVDVNLPENTMMEIRTGQKVQITNYSLPNDTLSGVITELSPAIDVNTRTYMARIRFANPKLLIRPGMFVKALIKVRQKDGVIAIPKDVVLSDQNGKKVFVVRENTAFERMIETGMETDDQVEIIGGLEENERLVVKGFETLRDRSKVKVLQ